MYEANDEGAIGSRPRTFRAARREAHGIRFLVNPLRHVVDPSKAKRLLDRLFVGDRGDIRPTRLFLIVNQPDFFALLPMLSQPVPPLLTRGNQQRFSNLHTFCPFSNASVP